MKLTLCIWLSVLIVSVSLGNEGDLNKTPEANVKENVPTDPVIQLSSGTVLGRKKTSTDLNKTYYAFEGIPYAKPPLGNLRFQPPVPNDNWTDTLDARTNKSSCIQNNGSGSEDCLYMNVATPSLQKKNIPVMVWIYGGAFTSGGSSHNFYNPEYLVEQDVVYAAFNYRLGVFGFISTDDLVAPGNAGLKDQVLALKWVKNNIASFGGNPENITIFGESAGAASVSYLLESNLTKGLFHRAIMESGTTLCLWSLSRNARETAFQLGDDLDVDTTNSSTLISGLQKINATALQQQSSKLYIFEGATENLLRGLPYGPVMEPDHEGALFSGKSHKLLSNGKFHRVPTIIGHNSQEAAIAYDLPALIKLLLAKYEIPVNLVPVDMNINSLITSALVGDDIKDHYFNIAIILSKNKYLVQFISDDQFNRPITETVKLTSKYSPVYFYVFSYESESANHSESGSGVGHAEELRYIFGGNLTKSDILTKNRMIKLWTNFAKYGLPTPAEDPLFDKVIWHPANINNNGDLIYLDINRNFTLGTNPNEKNIKYYNNLYDKFGNPPYDTY